MRKLLVSLFGIVMIAGTAFALPSVGDRRKACEENPDTKVWVEKTQACVDINPCYNHKHGAYCEVKFTGIQVKDESKIKDIIQRYFENMSHNEGENLTVESVKFLGSNADGRVKYYAAETADKGYMVFSFYGKNDHELGPDSVKAACWAYGGRHGDGSENWVYECEGIGSETVCNDIADFALYLSGVTYDYYYGGSSHKCRIYI